MKLWGQGVQRLVSRKSKVKNGTRLGDEQDSTRSNKTVTDRYRCGPDSNSTQTDRNMADWYGCGPKTQTQTDKMMTDRYRCGPDSNWSQTDRKMVDRYRYDLDSNWTDKMNEWLINIVWSKKLKLNSNWHEEWTIDIGWSWLKLKTPTDKMNYWSI